MFNNAADLYCEYVLNLVIVTGYGVSLALMYIVCITQRSDITTNTCQMSLFQGQNALCIANVPDISTKRIHCIHHPLQNKRAKFHTCITIITQARLFGYVIYFSSMPGRLNLACLMTKRMVNRVVFFEEICKIFAMQGSSFLGTEAYGRV